MNRSRLSLLGLMGAIAVLAAGFAAFRIPWLPVQASALFTQVVFILLAATLGSLLSRGASWIGFAYFGWGWLVISFASLAVGAWNSGADRIPAPLPIASMWLVEFHSSLQGDVRPTDGTAAAVIPNSQGNARLVSCSLVQVYHFWAQPVGGVHRRRAGVMARRPPPRRRCCLTLGPPRSRSGRGSDRPRLRKQDT